MYLIEELKKSIYAHYQTLTLNTIYNVPCYMDHVPQSVSYPIVTYYHISSTNKYAMPVAGTAPTGFDYANVRIQFSLYGNDRQQSDLETYANLLEDGYHKIQLTMGNGCTNIGTLVTGSRTKFWDEKQKIWGIHQDFMFMVGK